jgi:histidyl-tRNA synthetase
MKFETAPPRGMRDLLPREVELRDRAAATILATYKAYGFRRIETPALEHIELLLGSEGGENEKLIFKVLKRGAKLESVTTRREEDLADLGLRFDLTVPLARYYAHHRSELPDPFKAIQIGPVWRAERPQKGRFRQFTQCDIDILGVASEIAEIELILATAEALIALGLEHPTIRLNDRRLLTAIVAHCGFDAARQADVCVALDKLDKIGREGVERELRAAGHDERAISRLFALVAASTDPSDRAAAFERLCGAIPEVREPVEGLRTILRTVEGEAGQRYGIALDPTLVRGMGYYTGPIFEAASAGYASSIAGGGRYDRMLGRLLGQDVPACGFSIGFERVVSILEAKSGVIRSEPDRIALIFDPSDGLEEVIAAANRLRKDGRIVSMTLKRRNLAKQLDELAREGFGSYAVFRAGAGAPDVKPLVLRAPAPSPADA